MSSIEDLGSKFIFILVFLGIFFAVIAITPAILIYGKTYTNYKVPSYFSPEDIKTIKYYKNGTINIGGAGLVLDFNSMGIDYYFIALWQNPPLTNYIVMQHKDMGWWIFSHFDQFTFSNENPHFESTYINEYNARTYWDPSLNASSFTAKCNHVTVKLWLADTDIQRNNITLAWNEGQLQLGVGLGYQGTQTTMSAWELVARLLTFQAPEIFGEGIVGLTFNFILALPIYGMISYLVYRLVLMAIPFLGG